MAEHWIEIKCVKCIESDAPWDRITHVGGRDRLGLPWRLTQAQAIQEIESDLFQYYVSIEGQSVPVVVETGRFGKKYIKTALDRASPDGLLALAECPAI